MGGKPNLESLFFLNYIARATIILLVFVNY